MEKSCGLNLYIHDECHKNIDADIIKNANDRSDDFVLSCFVPESDEPLPEPLPDPDPQPASKLSDMHRHAPTANNFLNFLIIFTSTIMCFVCADSLSKNCS